MTDTAWLDLATFLVILGTFATVIALAYFALRSPKKYIPR